MDVFKRHTELDKPLHDLAFSKVPSFFFGLFNLVCKVSHFAKLHNYDQFTFLIEACPVRHNMGMVKLTKKHRFKVRALSFFVRKLSLDNFLSNEINIFWRISKFNNKCSTEISTAHALKFFKFFGIGEVRKLLSLLVFIFHTCLIIL